MAALIDLCNRALAAVAKGQIASLGEVSLEARECVRHAQPLLNEMIEWSDSIPLGRKRVVLAQVANDRPAEWLYCYQAPADMGMPLGIRRVENAATDLALGGPGNFPWQDSVPLAYLYEGDKIYSNVDAATLIYMRSSIDASELSAQMQKAFVDALAARIAMPLTKDPKIEAACDAKAERSRPRALAYEENKAPLRQQDYVSDAEYARLGIGV